MRRDGVTGGAWREHGCFWAGAAGARSRSGRWSRSSRRRPPPAWQLPDRHEPADKAEHSLARLIAERIKIWLTDETPLASTGRAIDGGRRDDPPAAARHPAGPAGAPAQAAARAGRGRRPPGPDRRDRGHGPDRAGRRAAAAGGRSDARGGPEEPAVRARRGGSVRARLRPRRMPACTIACARWRARGESSPRRTSAFAGLLAQADFLPPFEFYTRLLGEGGGRETVRRAPGRRGARADRGVFGAGAGVRARPSALAAGLSALAAGRYHRADPRPGPAARRGARADGARRQGPGGAGRGARRCDLRAGAQAIACCGSRRTGCRSGRSAAQRRDRVSAAAHDQSRRRQLRGAAPTAVRRDDPGAGAADRRRLGAQGTARRPPGTS